MTDDIKGKVVVIIGASSGLGEATARLSAEGAPVVLGARRVERLQSLARELIVCGGKALAIATDVTDREQVKKLVDTAVETYGSIDVMINNARLMQQSPLERLKVDDQGCPLRHRRGAATHAAAKGRPHYQRLLDRRAARSPEGAKISTMTRSSSCCRSECRTLTSRDFARMACPTSSPAGRSSILGRRLRS